jgi:flagellar basal body-associated protein FliL
MGKGGFMESKWVTIILAIVLVILAVVVFMIITGRGFEGCKRKPKVAPPGKITMIQNYQPINNTLATTTDLSWKKLA